MANKLGKNAQEIMSQIETRGWAAVDIYNVRRYQAAQKLMSEGTIERDTERDERSSGSWLYYRTPAPAKPADLTRPTVKAKAEIRVTKAQQNLLLTANAEGAIKPKGAQIRAAQTLMDEFGYLDQSAKHYVEGKYTITDAGVDYLRVQGLIADPTPPAAAVSDAIPAEAYIPAHIQHVYFNPTTEAFRFVATEADIENGHISELIIKLEGKRNVVWHQVRGEIDSAWELYGIRNGWGQHYTRRQPQPATDGAGEYDHAECWQCGTRYDNECYDTFPHCPACGALDWDNEDVNLWRRNAKLFGDKRDAMHAKFNEAQRQLEAAQQRERELVAALDSIETIAVHLEHGLSITNTVDKATRIIEIIRQALAGSAGAK